MSKRIGNGSGQGGSMVDVLIVGGGPAGLTAAHQLRTQGDHSVLVVDRERATGGIPRHSDHPGYGIRDLGKFISGPAYGRYLTERALQSGAQLRTQATVTGWGPAGLSVQVTSPQGRETISARAIVLATGARERPRTARLVPGDRSAGVYTTGQLQNAVHLFHQPVGKRAVVVGAELVSWSAVMTLKEAGCSTEALVSQYVKPEAYGVFNTFGRVMFKTHVETRSSVVEVFGKPRVEGVTVENIDTGERQDIACDTVVFTGDWIPDNELFRAAGIELNRGTKGPVVDAAFRTSVPGVFAIGNALHPVATADIAALDGAHVASTVGAYLAGNESSEAKKTITLVAEKPFRWVSPTLVREGETNFARDRLVLWADDYIALPKITVSQGGRELVRRRVAWPVAPGRVFNLPSKELFRDVTWDGSEVRIGVAR